MTRTEALASLESTIRHRLTTAQGAGVIDIKCLCDPGDDSEPETYALILANVLGRIDAAPPIDIDRLDF